MRRAWILVLAGCGSPADPPDPPMPDAPPIAAVVEDVAIGIDEPGAIAVDETYLYFTHGRGDISRVAKTGGAAAATGIATGLRGPSSLDVSTGQLCWINTGTHAADFLDGSVQCGSTQIASAYFPSGLAVDGATLFWVEVDGQRVRSIRTDGTNAQTLDDTPTSKTSIAITPTKLAWAATGDMADIVVMDRATGAKTPLSSQEYSPTAIVIVGDDVYWVTQHALSDRGALRVSRAGAAPVDAVPDEHYPRGLFRTQDFLYWTSQGHLRALALADGTVTTVAADRGHIAGMATDGTYLYWAERDRGAIVRLRR